MECIKIKIQNSFARRKEKKHVISFRSAKCRNVFFRIPNPAGCHPFPMTRRYADLRTSLLIENSLEITNLARCL